MLPMACIDPYEVEVGEGEQLLTIEGMITTQPEFPSIRQELVSIG